MTSKFVITKNDGHYIFTLKSGNNTVMLTSDNFATQDAAKALIYWIKENATVATVYDANGNLLKP